MFDLYLVQGSNAAGSGFYHRSFLEACFRRQAHDASSGDVGLGNSEVFCESAGIEICLLEMIAHGVISSSAVVSAVEWEMVMCVDSIRYYSLVYGMSHVS